MTKPIFSSADDTLETILEKIKTPEDLTSKLQVYTMFRLTRASEINPINMFIQLKDPELWSHIKKEFYPSFFDKAKKFLKL